MCTGALCNILNFFEEQGCVKIGNMIEKGGTTDEYPFCVYRKYMSKPDG